MKTVLITGASRGIGRELALAFGRAGYAVGINYEKEKTAAESVIQEIYEAGNKEAEVFPCDVRDSIKVRQMIDDLTFYEHGLSGQRRSLHAVIDHLQEEIVRRYKTGEATVDNLLSPP